MVRRSTANHPRHVKVSEALQRLHDELEAMPWDKCHVDDFSMLEAAVEAAAWAARYVAQSVEER